MAKLTEKDVVHVAKLAHLAIDRKELPKFQKQLSSVVDFVGQLAEIDTNGIEPTSQTTGLENIQRSDEVDPSCGLDLDVSLSGTEKTHNGYFVAGRVIKK